jgi:hypothetical protein
VDDADVEVLDEHKNVVQAWTRPTPMWCRRPARRGVMLPVLSTRPRHTRLCVSVRQRTAYFSNVNWLTSM